MRLVGLKRKNKYLLVDTSDWSEKWLTLEELQEIAKDGKTIQGYSSKGVSVFRDVVSAKATLLGTEDAELIRSYSWAKEVRLADFGKSEFLQDLALILVDFVESEFQSVAHVRNRFEYQGHSLDFCPEGFDNIKAFLGALSGLWEVRDEVFRLEFRGMPHLVNIAELFYGSIYLKDLTLDFTDSTCQIRYINRICSDCINLERVTFIDFDFSHIPLADCFRGSHNLIEVNFIGSPDHKDYKAKFGFGNLSHMFYECHSLKTANFSDWDVSNVTGMDSLFQDCRSLERVDISNWHPKNFSGSSRSMFCGCSELKEVYLPEDIFWGNTDATYMFCNCKSLEVIQLSKSGRLVGNCMFMNCQSLKKVDMSGYILKGECFSMFEGCTQLEEVRLGEFDSLPRADLAVELHMFDDCPNLKRVYVHGIPEDLFGSMHKILGISDSVELIKTNAQ